MPNRPAHVFVVYERLSRRSLKVFSVTAIGAPIRADARVAAQLGHSREKGAVMPDRPDPGALVTALRGFIQKWQRRFDHFNPEEDAEVTACWRGSRNVVIDLEALLHAAEATTPEVPAPFRDFDGKGSWIAPPALRPAPEPDALAALEAENRKLHRICERVVSNMQFDAQKNLYIIPTIAWFAQPYMYQTPDRWLMVELEKVDDLAAVRAARGKE